MDFLANGIVLLLFVPYLGWGIYTLYIKFSREEEFSPAVEIITLVSVVAFLLAAMLLLRTSMRDEPFLMIFTILGLLISAVALYGHLLVALVSQTVVNLVHPPDLEAFNEPRLVAADAYERVGDYDGALAECLVQVRLFPKHEGLVLRIAGLYAQLEQYDDAAEWFELAFNLIDDEDRTLNIANRLSEIYARKLDRPRDAARILEEYLYYHPDSERADVVRNRIERISRETVREKAPLRESLAIPPADPLAGR